MNIKQITLSFQFVYVFSPNPMHFSFIFVHPTKICKSQTTLLILQIPYPNQFLDSLLNLHCFRYIYIYILICQFVWFLLRFFPQPMLIRNYVLNLLVFKNFGSNLYYGNHHMDFLYRPQIFFFFLALTLINYQSFIRVDISVL